MWKRIFFIVISFWPLVIALHIFSIAQQYYLYSQDLPSDGKTVNYQFFVDYVDNRLGIACCFAPLAILAIAWWSSSAVGVIIGSRTHKTVGVWSALVGIGGVSLLLYANALACLATTPGLMTQFDELDTTQMGTHIFYLTGQWSVGIGHNSKAWYTFYECELSSTKCHIVHEKLYHVDEKEYDAMKAKLVSDSKANTVSFVINDRIIYTHHPG